MLPFILCYCSKLKTELITEVIWWRRRGLDCTRGPWHWHPWCSRRERSPGWTGPRAGRRHGAWGCLAAPGHLLGRRAHPDRRSWRILAGPGECWIGCTAAAPPPHSASRCSLRSHSCTWPISYPSQLQFDVHHMDKDIQLWKRAKNIL